MQDLNNIRQRLIIRGDLNTIQQRTNRDNNLQIRVFIINIKLLYV